MNVCVLCLRGVEDVSHNYTRLPSVLMHSLELLFHLFGIHWVMPGLVKDRSEIWYDAYFFLPEKAYSWECNFACVMVVLARN